MKKIKKILIFTFIAVLGFLSFALPLTVSAQTSDIPKTRKFYFGQEQFYTEPGTYRFDFSYIDEYYNYFIFVFRDNQNRDIYLYDSSIDDILYNVNTGSGFLIEDRDYLKFDISFNRSFMNNDDYILATNYDYIYNLSNNLLNEYTDGYNKALDDVYEYGFTPLDTEYENQGSLPYQLGYYNGVESVDIIDYEDVYNDGYDKGYDNGIKKVYNYGFIGTDFNDNKSYPYYQGYNKGIDIASDNTFYGIISQVFAGIGAFLAIELLPNITFGAILSVPLVFGIIAFIIGKRGGKDD